MTTRRALLTAGLVLPLAGCGVRLERDAPALPGVPTQAPPVDQALLQTAITRLRGVVAALGPLDPVVASRHRTQLTRLIAVAASDGITAPPTTPSSTAVPSSTTSVTNSAGSVESEQLTAAWLARVATASDRHRPVLAAILASHQWGARTLHGAALPVRTGLAAADAAVVLRRFWVATYAAEQLIARTPMKQRDELSTLLTWLYAERSRLTAEAGPLKPTEPLSYALPSTATDASAAREVMGPLLADIVTANASISVGGSKPGSIARLTQLWGDSAAHAVDWGQVPDAFLGLT